MMLLVILLSILMVKLAFKFVHVHLNHADQSAVLQQPESQGTVRQHRQAEQLKAQSMTP